MLIFLVGFMGCGKSTLGLEVSGRLGYDFLDTDNAVETLAGISIAEIFRDKGEEHFRALEREVLLAVNGENTIVATGGGMPCWGDNIAEMKRRGIVVYLQMTPQMLADRLADCRASRPKIANLNDEQLLEYITTTLAQREKYYSQADTILDCRGLSDDDIVAQIIELTKINRE